MEKKKGFSLIEILIVLSITAIMMTLGTLSTRKRSEQKQLEEARWKISETLETYKNKSYNEHEKYKIVFYLNEMKIKVSNERDELLEVIELPKSIKYAITEMQSGTEVKLETKEINTGIGGGITNFSIYLFDRNDSAYYRISTKGLSLGRLSSVDGKGYSKININKNRSSKVTYENVTEYDFEKNDWQEIQ